MADLTEHDAACLGGWPAIEWRKPITVRTMNGDGSSRLCCRLCVVRLGLRARDGNLPIRVPQQRGFFSPFEKDTWTAAMNIATALTLGDMTVLR
jgi:hypothetical protein